MPNIYPTICIMGPTATGKSAIALKVAEKYNGEIISVDSSAVYRDMDIGSAKPSAKEMAQIPHHLINIRNPEEPYSAGEFCGDALTIIKDLYAKNKTPILVGGTMLYFHSLLFGIAEMPKRDEKIRKQLEEEKEQLGIAKMHSRLHSVDPKAAERINSNDWQRIQRALEVFMLTNKTITSWQRESKPIPFSHPTICIALKHHSTESMHTRIKKRLDKMLELGFIEEVKKLHSRKELHKDLPALRAVGYNEAWQYLDGNLTYDEMYEKIIIATRQLVKHQMTWLKKWPNLNWFDCEDANLLTQIENIIALKC